ncbi:MAG: hypothetical protein IJS39_05955 [Synergistaceae bacterium]|nr:hypothetical protein [Synergistaceae bacterium]
MLAVITSPFEGVQSCSQRPPRSSRVMLMSSAVPLALSVKVKLRRYGARFFEMSLP